MTDAVEQWRAVHGNHTYSVSDLGRVKNNASGLVLKPWTTNGYAFIRIILGTVKRSIGVHRLVAWAFLPMPIPRPDGKPFEVNHKNGKKSDNRVENLEWVTRGQNIQHAYKLGLRVMKPRRGELARHAKLVASQVLEIRARSACGESHKVLGAEYGVHPTNVGHIVKRRSWMHI